MRFTEVASRATAHRLLRSEPLWAILAGIGLAVLLNWPIVTNLDSTVPRDLGDPLFFAWALAWPGYALTHGKGLWEGNIFYPEPDGFAYTDTLLGYLPLSFIGSGPDAAIARLNIVFLLAFVMAFVGAYALVRQLGGPWPAAALGGIVWAAAPWRLTHENHINILTTGAIALALFALARGHGFNFIDGYRPEKVRPGWIVTGWCFAAWQITTGFAIGLPFVYVMVLLALIAAGGWIALGSPGLPKPLIFANIGGGVFFLLVTYFMARPYLRIAERYGVERTQLEVDYFSPPPRGLLTAPEQSWAWGDAHQASRLDMNWAWEMSLLPGFTVLVLAVFGLFYSAWKPWIRYWLAGGTVLMGILALGTNFLDGVWTYLPLWESLPGFNALRTPGRMILWATLFLLLLAAGAITRFAASFGTFLKNSSPHPDFGRRLLAGVLVIPLLFAVIEGRPNYVYATPWKIPPTVQHEFQNADGPILVLPTTFGQELTSMLWSTDGFPQLANGSSSFEPPPYAEVKKAAETFPSVSSIEVLRKRGIKTVIVIPQSIYGTLYQNVLTRPVYGLPVTRTDHDDAVVFDLH
ncbi:MAG: hypothetical protein HOQ05_08930 [Corynebacteriales bacterium]|nr:hypothetical protein [Mycobacteriales bacterium]